VLRETLADLAKRLRVATALVARAGDGIAGSVFRAAKGDAL
jgi:hypothetical protein